MFGGETPNPAVSPDRIRSAAVKFDPKTIGTTFEARWAFLVGRLFGTYSETLTVPDGTTLEEFKAFLLADWKFRISADPDLEAYLNDLVPYVVESFGDDLYYQIRWASKTLLPDEDRRLRRHFENGDASSATGSVATAGDPVNLFDGSLSYTTEDLTLDGAGATFRFTRCYSQQSAYNGPLGFKWNHNYNIWLRSSPDGTDLTLSEGGLQLHRFRRHRVHGYFLPPDGRHAVIAATNASFELRESDGRRISFRPHDHFHPDIHVADRVTDRFGNYLAFRYSDGVLTEIEVNLPGRVVSLEYDALYRVTAVADFTGRTWRYAYDDLGDLSIVSSPGTSDHPGGLHTQYVYSSAQNGDPLAQHNLLRIVGGDGRIYLENEYGTDPGVLSFNRVVRQRQANGETMFEYADVVEDFDLPYRISERPAHQTIVTGADGMQTRALFNQMGNTLLEERYARLGGIPRVVTTHYRYNQDGSIVGTLSPLGVITQYLYGRDHYARTFPQAAGDDLADDANLTSEVRLGFGRVLGSVQRMRYYDVQNLSLASGLWSEGLLPDIYAVTPEDVITKFAYEAEFWQLVSSSDPRFTSSPDPNANESADYYDHLTRYVYGPGGGYASGTLISVKLPLAFDPEGNPAPEVVTHFTGYDARGRLLRTVGPNGLEILNEYFDGTDGLREGFLRSMTFDPNGLAIRFGVERDLLGRPTRQFRPKHYTTQDGRYFTDVEFNALGQVTRTTSTAPFLIGQEFTYDRTGKPLTARTELKDAAHGLTGYWDEAYRYDDQLQLVRHVRGDISTGDLRLSRAAFDGAGRPSISVPAGAPKEKYSYNERGLKSRRTLDYAGLRATMSFAYDADGRLIRRTDPGGHRTSYVYDPAGRGIEVTDALGGKVISHYDKAGNLLAQLVFEPDGPSAFRLLTRSEYRYDALNRVVVAGVSKFGQVPSIPATDLHGSFVAQGPGTLLERRYWYTAAGQVSRVEDYARRSSFSQFDLLGRVTKTTDPLGNEVAYTYDEENQVTRIDRKEVTWDDAGTMIVSEQFFAHATTYDEMNRVAATTNTLGITTRFDYDSRGNVVRVRGPLDTVSETTFDTFSRAVAETQHLLPFAPGESPKVLVTQFGYDDADQFVSVTDPLGRVTQFVRDSLGRRVSTVLPDGTTDLVRYDPCGGVAETHDRNGVVCRYRHDAGHRQVACEVDVTGVPPGLVIEGARDYAASYDGLGRRLSLENDFSLVQNTFNSLGLHVAERITHRNMPGVYPTAPLLIERDFTANGALSRLAYPSGRVLSFERDPLDRLTAIRQVQKGSSYPGDPTAADNAELARVSYEGHRRSEVARANGTGTRIRHDVAGRPIQIQHRLGDATLLDARYLYDALGNVRNRDESTGGPAEVQSYMYDSLSRLRAVTDVATRIDINNLGPSKQPVPDPIPDFQAQIDQRLVAGATAVMSFHYDDVGNRLEMTEGGVAHTFQPDGSDQYAAVDGQDLDYDRSGNLVHHLVFDYRYDHRGHLTSVANAANGDTTTLFNDASGVTIASTSAEGTRLTIYDGNAPIEEYLDGFLVASAVVDPAAGLPIVRSRDGGERFPYSDLTRSTRVVLDGGSQPNRYSYDPFGNPRHPITDEQEATFTGKRRIPGTRLHDFTFRAYDPTLGRFLQRDPAGYVDGTNLYAYVGNNPLSYFDPSGLERQEVWLGAEIGADYGSPPIDINDPNLGMDSISKFYFDEQGSFLRWNERTGSWVQDHTGINAILEKAPAPNRSWLERYMNGVEGAVLAPYHFAKDRGAQAVDMATQGWAVLGKLTGGWDTPYTTWSSTSKAVEGGATRGQILWDATGGQVVNSIVGIGDLIIKQEPEMIGAVAGSLLLGGVVARRSGRGAGVEGEGGMTLSATGGDDFIPGFKRFKYKIDGVTYRLQRFPGTTSRVLDPRNKSDERLVDMFNRSEVGREEWARYSERGVIREITDHDFNNVKIPLFVDNVAHTHPFSLGWPSSPDMRALARYESGVQRVLGRAFPSADALLEKWSRIDGLDYPKSGLVIETTYRRLPGTPKLIEILE